MVTIPAPPKYEDDIDLLRYGRFLASYAPLLAACAIIGGILGLFVASRAPVRYQASATVSVTQPSDGVALSPATVRALIANLTLVSEVLRETQLDRVGMTAQAFISGALEVQPIPTTNLVRLSVTLPDRATARQAAASLAQKAVDLSRRIDSDGAAASRDALKRQMDDAAQRLDLAQARLLKLLTEAHIDILEAEAYSKLRTRSDLLRVTTDLDAERARLTSFEQELARQPPVLAAPRANQADLIVGAQRREEARAEQARREQEDARRLDLRSTTRSAQPLNKRDDARVQYLRQEDLRPQDAHPADPRTQPAPAPLDTSNPFANPVYGMLQYEVAQSRAKVLALEKQRGDAGGTDLTKDFNELYRRKTELDRVQADYEVAKSVYSTLAQKHAQAAGRIAGQLPQLQIVDAPVQADAALPRRRGRFVLLGGLLGLAAGTAAALVVNRRRLLHANP